MPVELGKHLINIHIISLDIHRRLTLAYAHSQYVGGTAERTLSKTKKDRH